MNSTERIFYAKITFKIKVLLNCWLRYIGHKLFQFERKMIFVIHHHVLTNAANIWTKNFHVKKYTVLRFETLFECQNFSRHKIREHATRDNET